MLSHLFQTMMNIALLCRQDDPPICDILAERAQYVKPSQCGRICHVSPVEGVEGQGQGVREHHPVSDWRPFVL